MVMFFMANWLLLRLTGALSLYRHYAVLDDLYSAQKPLFDKVISSLAFVSKVSYNNTDIHLVSGALFYAIKPFFHNHHHRKPKSTNLLKMRGRKSLALAKSLRPTSATR